ncbi:iron-containing alcohol dehydrogenase, partial [Clostridium sp.]
MKNFEIKTNIYFGEGSLEYLQKIKGKKVFIVTDPFMVKSGTIDKITNNLTGKEYKIFSDIVPDPPIELIVSGIGELGKFCPDTIVALGG